MIKKIQLTKISIDNEERKDKNGKGYRRVGIQFQGSGEKWYGKLSYNDRDPERYWKNGDTVFVKLEQNGDYNNFKHPNVKDMTSILFDLIGRVENLEKKSQPEPQVEVGTSPVADDLPY